MAAHNNNKHNDNNCNNRNNNHHHHHQPPPRHKGWGRIGRDIMSRLQRMLTWKLTTLLILAVSDAKRDVKAPVSFTSTHTRDATVTA